MTNSYLEVAVEAALEGGAILLAEFAHPAKISYKGEVDIVTQADRRSEQAMVTRLRTHFPTHAIVAEEGGGYETDSPFRWHVDPLDGTTNFAHGYPCFAVSIGLEEDGELIAGAIYQPISKELFTAAHGEGAYSESEAHSRFEHRAPGDESSRHGIPQREAFAEPQHPISTGTSLCGRTACGGMDLPRSIWRRWPADDSTASGSSGCIRGTPRQVFSWCAKLVGRSPRFRGKPYRPGDHETLASNGHVHEEMREVAAGVPERAAQRPLT